jgi:hypothetical protein
MPIDSNGNILHTITPLILDQHTDLCPLFKMRAMNRAIAQLNRPSRGQISFQPALAYEFNIDASCIQMPVNWQAEKILATDEIATIRFPDVKAGHISNIGMPSGVPSITTNELMLRFLDTEVLLTSLLDPDSSFPPNERKIALHSDSLKRSITDGMYTVEDAELIIEAAAELASVTEFYNQNSFTTWEEEHGPDDEDNNHNPAQRQNDRDLVQHHNNHTQNDRKLQGKPKSDFQ